MRKLLFVLLVVMILCVGVSAYEVPEDFSDVTLEEAVAEFMDYYQLTEDNFSMSYYNTVTGESYDFNELKFALAASTYKLPLNMYFYELEAAGGIDPNATFRHTGMTLAQVRRESILNSNNEVSEAMIGYWGNYYEYKESMRKYSTIAVEDISPTFYTTNHSCTRMMVDTLKYLYNHSSEFEELIDNMKHAMPGAYFQAGVSEYEVAHKYGQVDSVINDVAIIYTPQPFLLAVYTQGIYGSGVCAQAARLMTNYTVWKSDYIPKSPLGEGIVRLVESAANQAQNAVDEMQPTVEPEVTAEPEETQPEEEVTQPETAQTPSQDEITEQPMEETVDEVTKPEEADEEEKQEEPRADPVKQKEEDKSIWIFIGVASLLLLIAVPLLLRRRY